LAACAEKRWGIILLFCPLPWFTASQAVPITVPKAHAQILTIASANVHLDNLNAEPLMDWVRQAQADILVVIEVSPLYALELKTLTEYPFRTIVPSGGPFGLALLSRYPVLKSQVIWQPDGIPRIEAQIQWLDQSIDVIAYHPMPPISNYYSEIRNQQLRELAQAATASLRPTILAGDLNATPWSAAFSNLAEYGMRRATGLLPSWPTLLHGMQGLPIDQVLVTPHWNVVSEIRGPFIGSDHFPVLVRLTL
jgi:endonuclease/exonuclease/phosphatase (EEP) superfamily protein YafD